MRTESIKSAKYLAGYRGLGFDLNPVALFGPAMFRITGANKDLARAVGQFKIVQGPGKGLFFDMGVMQFAIPKAIAVRIQHFPAISIMVPTGIWMGNRDIYSPNHAGFG